MKSLVSSPQSLSRWWPPLVAALLCLPAALPYLWGDIPRSNDTLTHLYRAVELERLLRAGILIPRWAPDFAHGYGYPIFNYFAYLTHYLVTVLYILGLPLLTAIRVMYVVGTVGSGVSAFLLARDLASPLPSDALLDGRGRSPGALATGVRGEGGEGAGWVAAVAYAYSPYLLFTAHVRGGLPEVVALAFVPLAFWGVRKALLVLNRESKFTKAVISYSLLSVIAIAGFILSHIGMALQYLPLLGLWGLYVVLQGWLSDRKNRLALINSLGTLAIIFTVALGLTAFIWLPSVLELQYVQFDSAFARAGLVYSANFLHWPDLFAYPNLPVYVDVLNPSIIRSLPLAALIIVALGLFRFRSFSRQAWDDYAVLIVFFLLCCFLTLDWSKPLWDSISLLQRSAFPWRFLGPASLFIALASAMAIENWKLDVRGWRLDPAIAGLCISVLVVFATPFLFPPREPAPENPTLADLARYEIPPLLVGTTTTGEYTPIWVKEFPDTHDMQAALLEGRDPDRLDAPGATVEHTSAVLTHDVYTISSDQSINAVYRSFYFPGWEATLDGQPLDLAPTDPNGLIAFTLPAGQHTLDIRFGSTPIRNVAGIISALCVLLLGFGFWLAFTRPSVSNTLESTSPNWKLGFRRSLAGYAWILGFAYCSLFIVSLFILKKGPPSTQHPFTLDFGGELTLVGYNNYHLPLTNYQEITLVWQAQHEIGVPYGLNVRLTDDQGLIWSDTNIERPANWRFFPGTDDWPTDQYILDPYVLKPVRGTPPGTYHLEVIVYRADTLQALSVQRIGEYIVEAPTNEPPLESLLTLNGIALTSVETDRAEAAPGDPYRLTLYWQAITNAPPEQNISLELLDAQGNVAYSRTESIVPQSAPPNWKAGDVLRQAVFFRLPASLPGGGFHWRVGGVELNAATALTIHAPDRTFEIPTLTHPQTNALTESINLLGYKETIEGPTITIELAWQAVQEIDEPYRVFLHLLDANGNLVSQSDGEPANWSRPTTGWLPGEVVLDARTLTAPGPGTYSLSVGMVNEAGERVAEPIRLGNIVIP